MVSTIGPYNVFCDIHDDNGWTILMQREKMNVDFNRTWEEYKEGFGDLKGMSFSSISEFKGDYVWLYMPGALVDDVLLIMLCHLRRQHFILSINAAKSCYP